MFIFAMDIGLYMPAQSIGQSLQVLLDMAKPQMNIPCNPCAGNMNFRSGDTTDCNPNFSSVRPYSYNPRFQPDMGMPINRARSGGRAPWQPSVQPLDYIRANNRQPLYGDLRRLPNWQNGKVDYVYNMIQPDLRQPNPVLPPPWALTRLRPIKQTQDHLCGYPQGPYVPMNLSVGDQMREQVGYHSTGGNYPIPQFYRQFPTENVKIQRPVQMLPKPTRGVPTQNNPGNGNCGQYSTDYNLDGQQYTSQPLATRRGITPVAFPNLKASGEYLGPATMILPSHLTVGGIGYPAVDPRLYARRPTYA